MTYYRITYPSFLFQGCGRYAGGQGYNSIGHFCGGWAGNCGDGGIGGSTWYLVCDRCREKYLREKQAAAREKVFYYDRLMLKFRVNLIRIILDDSAIYFIFKIYLYAQNNLLSVLHQPFFKTKLQNKMNTNNENVAQPY